MLQLVIILKAVTEIALLAMLGQAVVGLFAGARREDNFVFQLFRIIASPATKLTRLIAPRFIIDRHIPWLTFILLFWVWLVLVFAKGYLVAQAGVAQ